jgi:hypothetical protein
MVEPLFSTTSTRAEVWLVLCEMCLSHPSVDVCSMTLTCFGSGWKPIWFDHFDVQSGWKVCDLYHFVHMFGCSGASPDG